MFLVAVAKSSIKDKLTSFNAIEIKGRSFFISVITDDFLTQYISETAGFSVIESPLVSKDDFKDAIFSRVKFRKDDNSFEIFRSTMSGPIYYHLNSRGEFYCSTHISALKNAGVEIEENAEALPEFFVYRITVPPRTLYKDIFQLSIGDRLCVKLEDKKCLVKSIDNYNPPEYDKSIDTIEKSSQLLFDCLSESVNRLNTCRNLIAVMLSGGIDSSVLIRICQNNFGLNVSYSTGYPFEDPSFNKEKEYAVSAGKSLGMTHRYYQSNTQDYLHGFLESISLAEQPLHHLQSVCFHLLFKEGIPQDKKIVISGHGAGAELGNFRSFLFMKDKMRTRILSKKPFKGILKTISLKTGRAKKFLETLEKSYSEYPLSHPKNPIWSWHDYGSKSWVHDYFNATSQDIINGHYNLIKKFEKRSIYDIWSIYDILTDDVTMAIWAKIGEGDKKILYCPYYDRHVLDYALSIPYKIKLIKPENRLRREIARRANVPEFIIERPKTGFGIKRKDWALQGGVFEPLVPLAAKAFDEKEIRKMQSSDPEEAMTFWNMLNFALWKRLCINDEPLSLLRSELDTEIETRFALN